MVAILRAELGDVTHGSREPIRWSPMQDSICRSERRGKRKGETKRVLARERSAPPVTVYDCRPLHSAQGFCLWPLLSTPLCTCDEKKGGEDFGFFQLFGDSEEKSNRLLWHVPKT
jgi:hypothetical protein